MKPIFPWLFPACVFIFAIYVCYRNWTGSYYDGVDKWLTFGFGGIITVLTAVLACVAGCGLSSLIGYKFQQKWIKSETLTMVTMRSTDGVKGSFSGGLFMVSGQVGSSQVYFFYTRNEDGSYQSRKWSPNSITRVFEDDRTDGQVIYWKPEFVSPGLASWLGWTNEDLIAVDFYIPKGSLKKTFTLE